MKAELFSIDHLDGFVKQCVYLGLSEAEATSLAHQHACLSIMQQGHVKAAVVKALDKVSDQMQFIPDARYFTKESMALAFDCAVKFSNDATCVQFRKLEDLPDPETALGQLSPKVQEIYGRLKQAASFNTLPLSQQVLLSSLLVGIDPVFKAKLQVKSANTVGALGSPRALGVANANTVPPAARRLVFNPSRTPEWARPSQSIVKNTTGWNMGGSRGSTFTPAHPVSATSVGQTSMGIGAPVTGKIPTPPSLKSPTMSPRGASQAAVPMAKPAAASRKRSAAWAAPLSISAAFYRTKLAMPAPPVSAPTAAAPMAPAAPTPPSIPATPTPATPMTPKAPATPAAGGSGLGSKFFVSF